MYDDDAAYFRQRASEERERARNAASPVIAEIHQSLATRYEALMERSKGGPQVRVASESTDQTSAPPQAMQ